MRSPLLILALGLVACGSERRSAEAFAARPEAARAAVEACDRGRRRADCREARAGLAEARRRQRMAAYERAF